jgi:3-deoxy-D-manno-octulosonic acid kinase
MSYPEPMSEILMLGQDLSTRQIEQFRRTDPARAWREAFPAGGGGRGTLRIRLFGESRLFIKREARGGVASLVLPVHFFFPGPFVREWELAQWLAGRGHTPRLMARWIFRAAGLLSVYTVIEPCFEAVPVSDLLTGGALDDESLDLAGRCIGKLHRNGVYHADLNISNILVMRGKSAVAIDWRHSYRTDVLRLQVRRRNLRRFVRSFWKAHHHGAPELSPSNWDALCEGYAAGFGVAEDWLFPFKRKCRNPSRMWEVEWELQARLKRGTHADGAGSST